MSRAVRWPALVVLGLSMGVGAPTASSGEKKPKAEVSLLASVDGVTPGLEFRVGLMFRVEEGWHIYWQNPGDAGVAPRVHWSLPAGFSASELTFPVPKRHIDPSGLITTNILEGETMLLATVSAPSPLDLRNARLEAQVTYLVCKESCLQERAQVAIELPVRNAGTEPVAVNAKSFAAAERALPRSESRFVTVRPNYEPSALREGSEFALVLDAEIASGHHIQSHTPINPAFVRADVFLERKAGLSFGTPSFPEPKLRENPVLGKLSEYSGQIQLRVPGRVEELTEGQILETRGILTFQACNDQGRCFPPEALSFSIAGNAEKHSAVGGESEVVGSTGGSGLRGPAPVVRVAPTAGSLAPDVSTTTSGVPQTFAVTLLFAFLGGLILNVMPCVLPVISIKILSFVQQSREEPRRVFRLGLAFCSGIMISFWVLTGLILVFKTLGTQVGWGFQFQYPSFVIVVMALVFSFGLSLLGVFEITLPGAAMSKLAEAEDREGYVGAFFKGVLGTILATPCLGPFLGTAIGAMFALDAPRMFLAMSMIGMGLALPFFLLTWQPAWLRYLPKPGPWMVHFKQLMGFLLIGTVVYLLFILGHQIGPSGLVWAVAFLGFVAMGLWILGLQTPLTPAPRRWLAWGAATICVGSGWWVSFGREMRVGDYQREYLASIDCPCDLDAPDLVPEDWSRHVPWQPWHKGRAEHLSELGYTVYVDYTAAWCATCLANKAATLESEAVRERMKDYCIIPLKADYTNESQEILTDLMRFQRSGVPLNVIYPAGKPDQPILMPEQLVGRSALVLEKLAEAGPSFACKSSSQAEKVAVSIPRISGSILPN